MAGSVNKVILVGNVGRDPEVRTFQNGGKVVNLRLATSERWKDSNGENRERTEWHTIAIFAEPLAKIAEQYLRKGSKIYVEGQLETRKWQDQSGNDRYSTEVVLRPYKSELTMLDGQGDGNSRSQGQQQGNGSNGQGGYQGGQSQHNGGGSQSGGYGRGQNQQSGQSGGGFGGQSQQGGQSGGYGGGQGGGHHSGNPHPNSGNGGYQSPHGGQGGGFDNGFGDEGFRG